MTDSLRLRQKLNLAEQLKSQAKLLFNKDYYLDADFQRISLAFAAKSYKTYIAALNLVKKGLPEPAFILVRSLLEDVVNLAYIAQEPDKRSALFLNFSVIEKKFYLDNLKEAGLLNKETETVWQEEFLVEYQKVKANYPYKRYWSSKNLKQMAEAVGPELSRTYSLVYLYSSGFVHGSSSLTLEDYLQQTKKQALKPLTKPKPEALATVLELAFQLFTRCLQIFIAACHLNYKNLEELKTQWEVLTKPTANEQQL